MSTTAFSSESFDSNFHRARLLFDQHRYADAAEWFQRALQHDPQHSLALAFLALSWIHDEKQHEAAVQVARQAVGLEPESSFHHAVLAICLLDSAKAGQDQVCKEGLASAEKAVEMDVDSDFAWGVKAQALARLRRWPEAEKAARQALALDTTNVLAAQVLSMSLLNQGKDEDLKSLADMQLSENPEDDSAHVTAGYRELVKGRHQEACSHFREALRIDATNEMARNGLIESFRARSGFYRLFLRFSYFMARFGRRGAGFILLGGYILYRVAFASLKTNHPGLAYTLAGLWLVFALWSFLARSIGSALMLTDRFVRLAITPRERWEGICVGLQLLLGIVFLAVGIWFGSSGYVAAALALVLSSVPTASAFSNDHHQGVWLYVLLASVSGGAALFFALTMVMGVLAPMALFNWAIYPAVACTWLRMLGVMYR